MREVTFLTLAEAVEIHNDMVGKYGGTAGVRDYGLLQAALSVPSATFVFSLRYQEHLILVSPFVHMPYYHHVFTNEEDHSPGSVA